jgi:hypothetical protein
MIFRSPYPDVDIPNVAVTSHALRREGEFGDKAALIDAPTGETITFSGLATLIRRAAGGLAARGVG